MIEVHEDEFEGAGEEAALWVEIPGFAEVVVGFEGDGEVVESGGVVLSVGL